LAGKRSWIGTFGGKSTFEVAGKVNLPPKLLKSRRPLDDTLAGQLFQLSGVDPDL
jgi:hypothetical protein